MGITPRKIRPGDKFGHLTVVEKVGKVGTSNLYKTICDCGNRKLIVGSKFSVQTYCSKACPLIEPPSEDLAGKRFGRWTALEPIRGTKQRRRRWLCRCDCGRTWPVATAALTRSKSRCCRHCRVTKWFSDTEKTEGKRARIRRHRQENPAKYKAYKVKRKETQTFAAPSWLHSDHWTAMNEFYDEARFFTNYTGTQHHVDHIVPLQGKTVCGLHVPWNLQILTGSENSKKLNKLIAQCVSQDTQSLLLLSALVKMRSLPLNVLLTPIENSIHFPKVS